MKTRNLCQWVLLCCSLSAVAAETGHKAEATVSPLIYSYDEMFSFEIEAYLASQAPHLLPYAEVISHWAGYSSISPRVLLAVMEMQSGIVTKPSKTALKRPFAGLSVQQGFAAQLQDVADQLARRLYSAAPEQAGEFGLNTSARQLDFLFVPAPLSESATTATQADNAAFTRSYRQLFQQDFPQKVQSAVPQPLAGPANGFLQFPFPIGQSWHVGGAHTNTGSGSYPMSSLDLSQGGGWGSNQSGVWVAASASGSFKRHSSCFAEVVHSGGWSTTYYHLMNVQYNTGANVSKNTRIANPANTKAQALCNGGASTGPHQHWSLKQNGSWIHLNGVYLSGWQITATGSSYDTNCNRYYLQKNGSKRCAGYFAH